MQRNKAAITRAVLVPIPTRHAGGYPATFGSGRISTIRIRYIPTRKT